MQNFIVKIFKLFTFLIRSFNQLLHFLIVPVFLYIKGVNFSSLKSRGFPIVNISIGGKLKIGSNFTMNNKVMFNPIGRFQKCCLIVGEKGELLIGKNVGISSTTIVCHEKVIINDFVKIGGNVVIYDTDFHSIDPNHRNENFIDRKNTITRPVILKKLFHRCS